ncbi:MAG: hypothetical protein ACRD1L_09570 [Terriglobales bacterium]
MRLRWAGVVIVIAACAYILACANAPPENDAPAVDTSGVELAPAEAAAPAAPRGVVSTARAEAARLANGFANAVTGKTPAKRRVAGAGTPGGGHVSPDIVPGCCCCCDPCCCDPCCCDPCGGGGGGSNFACVMDATVKTQEASLCGGANTYELEFSDNLGTHDTGQSVVEQTACTPYDGESSACMPFLTGSASPPPNGDCESSKVTVDPAPAFLVVIDQFGGMTWQLNQASFTAQTGLCGNSCEFDHFNVTAEAGISGPWPESPVCN